MTQLVAGDPFPDRRCRSRTDSRAGSSLSSVSSPTDGDPSPPRHAHTSTSAEPHWACPTLAGIRDAHKQRSEARNALRGPVGVAALWHPCSPLSKSQGSVQPQMQTQDNNTIASARSRQAHADLRIAAAKRQQSTDTAATARAALAPH